MAVLRGENLMVFVGDAEGNMTSIAYATNHTLSINLSTTETSNKDQGHGDWQTFEQGVMSWDISSDNLIGDGDEQGKTYTAMLDYMLEKKILKVAFAVANTDSGNYDDFEIDNVPTGGWKEKANANIHYVGNVIITSISTNAPNNDSASFTVSMQGVGALKKKTA